MEFSYRISEAEYLSAAKLKNKGNLHIRRIQKSLFFWIFIVICFLLFFTFYQHSQQQSPITDDAAIQAVAPSQTINLILTNLLPVVAVVGVFAYVIFRSVPMQLRQQYRKDPAMQGQSTLNITPESISIQITSGTTSKSGWKNYDYWRESKDLILMVCQSGIAVPISVASLSDVQRDELRSILTAALPKK
jgi:uncharacterized membrane protein